MESFKRTSDEFLNEQTKEQLIMLYHSQEAELEWLRQRMEKLTGCREFGALDGMDAACHICYYDEKELFDRCWNFTHGLGGNYGKV